MLNLHFSEKNKTHEFFFFLHNSEVRIYDPSGDSTIPSTSKKRKFEEMQEEEEEEEAAEPVTPVVKSKKKKEAAAAAAVEGDWQQMMVLGESYISELVRLILVLSVCFTLSRGRNSGRASKEKEEEEEG